MENPTIQTDLAQILNRLDSKFDKLSENFNNKIDKLENRLDKIDERLNKLEIGQAEIKGEIKAVDERLSGQIKALDTKTEQLDKRVGNQEFTNRGILVGLVLVILGNFAMFFWMSSKL